MLALSVIGWSCTRAENPETATPAIANELAEVDAVTPPVETPHPALSVPADPTTMAAAKPAASQVDNRWTRVVWTRDIGDGTDIISFGNQLVLMGYDSHDGRGERVLLEQRANYAKPLITPSGQEVVYTLRARNRCLRHPVG